MPGSKKKTDKLFYHMKFGFTLCQQNGQRTYGGPPPNWGSRPPPSRDCEVFIGRLPRMCFEDELIPLFLTAGEFCCSEFDPGVHALLPCLYEMQCPNKVCHQHFRVLFSGGIDSKLYEFRLMLDFSGTNRGYGYAHYATLEGAQNAIEKLNKYEIRPGHQIGVLKSKNNCRLLFGNIGSAMDLESFSQFIRKTTDQVLNVLMFQNFLQLKQTDFRISAEVEEAFLGRMPRNNGNNQFAIVEYENHKAAAVARRVLIPKYGHILAIDWAVPPRERKRFVSGSDSSVTAVERPLSSTPVKNSLVVPKSTSKIRPVPVLLVQPSVLDNVPFMSSTFNTIVVFFKYQLSVCLYQSVEQMEIPLFICREIERKIVDRITNLENCSQAVQLIFNYFSWYNEKKRCIINYEVQKLLQEVKFYADSFVLFVKKRLKYGPSQNAAEDNYYIHILPVQLNLLFRFILHSDAEYQSKLSSGITTGLEWLMEFMQKEGKFSSSGEFVEEINNLVRNQGSTSLDKAVTLAKSRFLSTITVNQQNKCKSSSPSGDDIIPVCCKSNGNVEPALGMENISHLDENSAPVPSTVVSSSFQKISPDFLLQHLKADLGHNVLTPFYQTGNLKEGTTEDLYVYPPVPLLFIRPSIMNKIPFMPEIFDNVLTYFKHLIRFYLNIITWQMNIPQYVIAEIKKKVVDRISNMENCGEGIQLILNYFSSLMEKKLCSGNFEIQNLLHEIKIYADSFVQFVWSKTRSIYIPNEAAENYFCKLLPLKLNLLFHVMLIFNYEHSVRFLIGITKGLNWLEELFEKGDKTAKEFLEELTRFVVEMDPATYEKAKNLGIAFCKGLTNYYGQPIRCEEILFPVTKDGGINKDKISLNSPYNTEVSNTVSITGSDNASEVTSDCDFYLF